MVRGQDPGLGGWRIPGAQRRGSDRLLAADRFRPDQVRADLEATRRVCAKHGCPLEFILKDISTVRYEPERLAAWARIAMQVAGG